MHHGAKIMIPTFLTWMKDEDMNREENKDGITVSKIYPLIKETASFLWASEWLLQDCSNH